MRDVYAESLFPVDPQMSALFDAALENRDAEGHYQSQELEVFVRLTSHPTVEPVLKQMGFSGRVIDMVARQTWPASEIPARDEDLRALESPSMALMPVVMGAFVESVARGRLSITPRDMTVAFLSQKPEPLGTVIRKLESALGFDAEQAITAIRTAPEEIRRTASMRI